MQASPLTLVVDDDPVMREILRLHLEGAGYRAALADSAADGLRKAQTLRPSVVVMDFAMPGGSGADALRVMRADEKIGTTPVLVMTAWSLEEGRVETKDLAATWVQKPIMAETLIESVRNLPPA